MTRTRCSSYIGKDWFWINITEQFTWLSKFRNTFQKDHSSPPPIGLKTWEKEQNRFTDKWTFSLTDTYTHYESFVFCLKCVIIKMFEKIFQVSSGQKHRLSKALFFLCLILLTSSTRVRSSQYGPFYLQNLITNQNDWIQQNFRADFSQNRFSHTVLDCKRNSYRIRNFQADKNDVHKATHSTRPSSINANQSDERTIDESLIQCSVIDHPAVQAIGFAPNKHDDDRINGDPHFRGSSLNVNSNSDIVPRNSEIIQPIINTHSP